MSPSLLLLLLFSQGASSGEVVALDSSVVGGVLEAADQAAGPGELARPIEPVNFNRDVRPILSDNCFACHGPDAESRKARLRLDTFAGATNVRRGRQAILPGDLDSSELVERILTDDEDDRMPPEEFEKHLSEAQKDILVRWIESGAQYQDHWAYIAPKRTTPPTQVPVEWQANPIDQFIADRLAAEKVEPAGIADPVTLVRRVHFDLTGLPPTPDVIDRFRADPSAAKFGELVDSLLASEHYGERMASYWLDLVRYADTMGYHSDDEQKIYPYRDYVIDAFNTNMGFDRFTKEQLAGDLLQDATLQQQVASGYNRLNQVTGEGGAQPGEYIAKYMADRIRTTSEVWLGATLGCAECHDHKYDPFTAKDFYQFGAFFADLEEVGVYSGDARNTGNYPPMMNVPQPGEDERAAELDERVEALAAQREKLFTDLFANLEVPEQTEWELMPPSSATTTGASTLELQPDGSVLSTGERSKNQNYTVVFETAAFELGASKLRPPLDSAGSVIGALRLELMPDPSFQGLGRGNGNIVLSGIEARLVGPDRDVPLQFASVETSAPTRGEWHPEGILDEDPLTGWAAAKDDDNNQSSRSLVFRLAEPLVVAGTDQLEVTLRHEADREYHNIGRFRCAVANDVDARLNASIWDAQLRNAIATPRAERSDADAALVLAHFKSNEPQELKDLDTALRGARAERRQFDVSRTKTMVSRTVDPRVTRIFPRGDWLDTSGEEVLPGVPHFLPQPGGDPNARLSRLDLANWMMDDANPLTARVFVNRLWYLFFGSGISNVLNDLGSQGEWPEHPELLDWLAVEFRESGWDIKHMVRLLVTSRAYQLSSKPDPEHLAIDPLNRLHARQARFRLQAEFVRDNALAISGLLQRAPGGPSVRPYQPTDYWADSYKSVGVPHKYEESEGADLYRRGLYTLWKRSFLHPSLLAFDAPLREACVARRPVSNTPLQALVLLNDPTYVEAARAFAARAMGEAPGSGDDRITWMFRHAVGREPSAEESRALAALYETHRERYAQDIPAAEAFLAVGASAIPESLSVAELAAWTSVARVVLNLHETITRN